MTKDDGEKKKLFLNKIFSPKETVEVDSSRTVECGTKDEYISKLDKFFEELE